MAPWAPCCKTPVSTTGGAPELWNVERPDVIRSIYQGYVDAGSHLIETNTFGGTRFRLKLHDLQDRVYELNHAGAAWPAAPPGRRCSWPGRSAPPAS